MRNNQVTIRINRFGDSVPENYPKGSQAIEVYCDDHKSIYAALSRAYALAVNELAETEQICVRTDVYTNEFDGDRDNLEAKLPVSFNKYELDPKLYYHDTNIKLKEEQLWIYENMSELLSIIQKSEDKYHLATELKEKFNLTEQQIAKLFQTRLDMLTLSDYYSNKETMQIERSALDNKEKQEAYRKIKKRKIKKDIDKLEAYFEFLEHFEDLVELIKQADSYYDLYETLQKNLGISRYHAAILAQYNLYDFTRSGQQNKKEQLEYFLQHLKNLEDVEED